MSLRAGAFTGNASYPHIKNTMPGISGGHVQMAVASRSNASTSNGSALTTRASPVFIKLTFHDEERQGEAEGRVLLDDIMGATEDYCLPRFCSSVRLRSALRSQEAPYSAQTRIWSLCFVFMLRTVQEVNAYQCFVRYRSGLSAIFGVSGLAEGQ